MAKMSVMPIDEIRKMISCDPESGVLLWVERSAEDMPCVKARKCWNSRFAGRPAINAPHNQGYLAGSINYRKFLAHRVAWAMYHGEWPEEQIDHVNGVKTDNRICNLRKASHSENMRNMKPHSDALSSLKGVCFDKSRGLWMSRIRHGRMEHYLGRFTTEQEAHAAYCQAAKKYHGEFARTE